MQIDRQTDKCNTKLVTLHLICSSLAKIVIILMRKKKKFSLGVNVIPPSDFSSKMKDPVEGGRQLDKRSGTGKETQYIH